MPDVIIRKADLPKYTGLKRTAIDELIGKGLFPRPVRLSERAVGWLGNEIAAWQAERVAERDAEVKVSK
jgi:prophage regulatory protein